MIEPNKLVLNPGVTIEENVPLCPKCEAPIKELSSRHENRFVCECDSLQRFYFPEVDDK